MNKPLVKNITCATCKHSTFELKDRLYIRMNPTSKKTFTTTCQALSPTNQLRWNAHQFHGHCGNYEGLNDV